MGVLKLQIWKVDKMVRGIGKTKVKKKPWKTRMERDIILHKDLVEAYFQKGKVNPIPEDKDTCTDWLTLVNKKTLKGKTI